MSFRNNIISKEVNNTQFVKQLKNPAKYRMFPLISLVVMATFIGSVLSFDPTKIVYGRKLEGYTFRTVLEVSAKQCWHECASRQNCRSFNYIRRFHLCELNTQHPDYTESVEAKGYVFSEVSVCIFFNTILSKYILFYYCELADESWLMEANSIFSSAKSKCL